MVLMVFLLSTYYITKGLALLDEACVSSVAHDPIPGTTTRRLNHQPLNQKKARALVCAMIVLLSFKIVY